MGRELILSMSVTVDGFVGGPNGEIDWIFRSTSDDSTKWIVEQIGQVSLHAMGHRTYQDMVAFWPTSTHPIAKPMNEIPKAVFSRSGKISPPNLGKTTTALKNATSAETHGAMVADPAVVESWLNPIVGGKDLAGDILQLKQAEGKPIYAHGGASFASSLIAAHVVDVIRLRVHPVVLGRGLSIFADLKHPLSLKLEDLKEFASGVVVKTYLPWYGD